MHPCAEGITVECFKAYPSFAKQALAYRMLYTIVPYEVIRLLPEGLSQPLISSETIIPSGIEFPPGWIVFPDVEFPPGYTIADPPPEGVFPPPVFSPLLPETGGSAPLFIPPFEPGPIRGPGGITASIIKEQIRRPISDISIQCTPQGGGSNFVEVYEEIADEDLTSNTAFSGGGNTDIFGIDSFTIPSIALNIKVSVFQSARATDFLYDSPEVVSSLRIGGVDYVHPYNADTSLDYPEEPFEFFYSTNPSGGDWTPDGVNSIQGVGYFSYIHEPISDVRHTQIFVKATWD